MVNLVGQRPIAMASDGHSLIFVGTDSEILSIQIGTLLLTSVFFKKIKVFLNFR